MARGFPKKNLAVIMNSKEMREYIQAIKRHYEARRSEIRILSSLDEEQKSETQNLILPDSQSVTNGETKLRNIILPDSQSVTNDETKLRLVTKLKTSSIGWLMTQWNKRNLVLRCHNGDMDELF